eukprot:m.189010 g.189010  ORF g.189010 m.189010 type:complete len:444 (-) comp14791_c0_seq2:3545-4876(-)
MANASEFDPAARMEAHYTTYGRCIASAMSGSGAGHVLGDAFRQQQKRTEQLQKFIAALEESYQWDVTAPPPPRPDPKQVTLWKEAVSALQQQTVLAVANNSLSVALYNGDSVPEQFDIGCKYNLMYCNHEGKLTRSETVQQPTRISRFVTAFSHGSFRSAFQCQVHGNRDNCSYIMKLPKNPMSVQDALKALQTDALTLATCEDLAAKFNAALAKKYKQPADQAPDGSLLFAKQVPTLRYIKAFIAIEAQPRTYQNFGKYKVMDPKGKRFQDTETGQVITHDPRSLQPYYHFPPLNMDEDWIKSSHPDGLPFTCEQVALKLVRHTFVVEELLKGDSFIKFNRNDGMVLQKPQDAMHLPPLYVSVCLAQAFSHWSYIYTGKKKMVLDVQGMYTVEGDQVKLALTDPAIANKVPNAQDQADFGPVAFEKFLADHQCNSICKILKL